MYQVSDKVIWTTLMTELYARVVPTFAVYNQASLDIVWTSYFFYDCLVNARSN